MTSRASDVWAMPCSLNTILPNMLESMCPALALGLSTSASDAILRALPSNCS